VRRCFFFLLKLVLGDTYAGCECECDITLCSEMN
jgi:hypothetical protein